MFWNRVAVVRTVTAAATVWAVTGALAIAGGGGVTPRVEAASLIPTAGLLGHWPLDGNALDTSGHGHNGTIVGAKPTTGVKGGAFAFDGNDHIDLPNFQFPNSTYTVSIWFETTFSAPTDWRPMFSQLDDPSGTGPFELALGVDGTPRNSGPQFLAWNAGVGPFNLFVPQVNPRDGRWHMITGTYKDGLQQLFFDGAFIKSSQFGGPLPTTDVGAHIGGQDFGPYHHPWIGSLDEAVLYDRVLSAAEVRQVFQASAPAQGADLTLTAQDTPDPVGIGDKLTYTLTATNHGPATASGVTVSDTLPGTASLLATTASQGSGCTHTSTVPVTVTCSLGSLASGHSATVRISVRPTATGTLANRASVHGSETPDPLASNNVVKVTTSVLDRLAFVSNRDGNNEIYTMLADGSQQKRLTTNPADGREPAWSPDRKRIAFVSHRDGNDELYVMNADGSVQTRLTTTAASEQMPAWSPDGTKLAFSSNRDGNLEIYIMPSSGGRATRLTTAKGDDKSPAWSPDGTRIAFTSRRDGNPEIYVMHADGSHQQRLTLSAGDDKNPSWSPDGTQLAFSSNRDGNDEIYVMHADGTSQTRLTRNGASEVQAAWSPDGTKIAFTSTRDGNQELYVMQADGTGQIRLTRNAAADFWPDWQPRLRPGAVASDGAVDAAEGVSTSDAVEAAGE